MPVFKMTCGLLTLLLLCLSLERLFPTTMPGVYPRRAEGPGGYLDNAYNFQRNVEQTGVHDQGVPLSIRQNQARRLGLPAPLR